jgi:hypothetical protein
MRPEGHITHAVHYLDKTDSNRKKIQHGEIVIVSETDRVYLNTRGAIELEDPVLYRLIRVTKQNSFTTVVWNPWVQAHSLADLADDEWTQMICIESSNVSDFAVDLAPGQQHKMKASSELPIYEFARHFRLVRLIPRKARQLAKPSKQGGSSWRVLCLFVHSGQPQTVLLSDVSSGIPPKHTARIPRLGECRHPRIGEE